MIDSLLQKLADREQTISDDILNSFTQPDPQEPKVVGPLTSPEDSWRPCISLSVLTERTRDVLCQVQEIVSLVHGTIGELTNSHSTSIIPSHPSWKSTPGLDRAYRW